MRDAIASSGDVTGHRPKRVCVSSACPPLGCKGHWLWQSDSPKDAHVLIPRASEWVPYGAKGALRM